MSATVLVTSFRRGELIMVELPLFTPRMLDYLRCAAAGLTREETAVALCVSVEGAKSMRREILRRADARNMTQAVARAYEEGLL